MIPPLRPDGAVVECSGLYGPAVRLVGLVLAPAVLVAVLVFFAVLESAAGWCAGCWAFGRLMAWGLVPEETCLACADLALARR